VRENAHRAASNCKDAHDRYRCTYLIRLGLDDKVGADACCGDSEDDKEVEILIAENLNMPVVLPSFSAFLRQRRDGLS
jgi:hypothetical protein